MNTEKPIAERDTSASQMHLEPGLSTCIVRPAKFDPANHFPAFAAAGFKCIELNCFIGSDDFPWDRAGRVKELRDIAQSTGVAVYSVHAEGGIGLCLGPRSERLAIDIYRSFADLAAELGAGLVVIHGDLPRGIARSAAESQFRRTLEVLADHVRDMPCAFGWENLPHKNNPPDALSVEEHVAWIRELGLNDFGFVLDTGHSNLAGNTEAYLRACKGVLTGLHINDNDATGDQHRAPGFGNVNWKTFVPDLLKNDYLGPLMLEIVGTGTPPRELSVALAEARASIEFLRNIDGIA